EDKDCLLLTQDFSMVIKAKAMGINVEYYNKTNSKKLSDMYKGYVEIEVDEDVVDYFYSQGKLDRNAFDDIVEGYYPNMFIVAKSKSNSKKSFIAMYKKGFWQKLNHAEKSVFGIKAKDAQQKMALELMLDDDIQVVTITAGVGMGKTLLSLAVGLDETVNKDKYDSVLLGKNTTPLDKWSYNGFTTGSTTEKLLTHFGNYTSNLEYLHNLKSGSRRDKLTGEQVLVEYMEQLKAINILDISSILGSSFQGKFVIIDEAQSFGFDAMRAILTRVGQGSKLLIIGDVLQQTVDKLDIDKSGLFFAVQHLKDLDAVGHVTLGKVHRSEVVSQISKKFDELV
ncbi:MAG: PhoH family protein, partial [Cetobacterium sp.]